ncbi:MAG: ABC transporter ATP-binding protein/permease [Candidatus Zambryskibacteria bacterium]|nr:ABC transporter ATP-binding protein/permease [Candidatus Zambryskibacteria bacterium]
MAKLKKLKSAPGLLVNRKIEEDKNPLLYLFGKTWQYSEGSRDKVVWYWIMFIVANIIPMIGGPLVFARMMNTVQQEGITSGNFRMLIGLLSLTLVFELIFWSLHGPARCIERNNAFKVRLNYRRFLMKGVMTLPMEWHVDHHSGDTIDKIEKGTQALFSFAEDSFIPIWGFVQFTVSLVMLIYFGGWSAAVVVLTMLAVSIWITVRFNRIMIPQYKELNKSENQISESVFDAISNISTVIILRVEKLVFKAIMHKVEKPYELFKRNQRLNEYKWFLTNMCCTIMTILVLAVYFWQNLGATQGIMVGTFFILIRYLDRVSELFFRFTSDYSDMIKRKSRIMNSEELTSDFKTENFTNHVLPAKWERLRVSGLNFAYQGENNEKLHLDDLSFSLEHSKKYAVIGRSGDGKSTLFSVMIDLFHASGFNLEVDEKEIREGFRGICRGATLIPQKPDLFANTINWNITMGADHDIEFVRCFTDMACFTDVVERLPKKFDSSIKEKGVNLSGGEQQRLALARGLLACHDKDIVLLDEPTSSLDAATEMRVYRNIFREFQDKTIVSSVHRLHLLPMFDHIYMFSGGRIIASGTLQELLTTCPEFQELWHQYHEHKDET